MNDLSKHSAVRQAEYRTVILKDGTVETEYVVRTNLRLDVMDEQHDKKAVDELLEAAGRFHQSNPGLTRVIVAESPRVN